MELRAQFVFNEGGLKRFTIINPPTLPCTGEMVDFDWEEFVTDKRELKKITDFTYDRALRARILSRRYSRDFVKIIIILHTEEDYYRWEYDNKQERENRMRQG